MDALNCASQATTIWPYPNKNQSDVQINYNYRHSLTNCDGRHPTARIVLWVNNSSPPDDSRTLFVAGWSCLWIYRLSGLISVTIWSLIFFIFYLFIWRIWRQRRLLTLREMPDHWLFGHERCWVWRFIYYVCGFLPTFLKTSSEIDSSTQHHKVIQKQQLFWITECCVVPGCTDVLFQTTLIIVWLLNEPCSVYSLTSCYLFLSHSDRFLNLFIFICYSWQTQRYQWW